MAFFIFFLLLAQASLASIPDFPSEGLYQAKSYDVLLAIRHMIVPTLTPDYAQKIQDLKDEGFTCGYTSMQATKCTKQELTAELPESIKNKILENWFGYTLEINDLRADPSQTIDGEAYQEWSMPQEVKFKGKSFSQYRLMVTEKIKKLALGQTYVGAEFYFNYTSNSRRFEMIIQETQTRSRFEFVSFLIAVKFK